MTHECAGRCIADFHDCAAPGASQSQSTTSGLKPEAIAQGTALVEDFLHAWTAVAPSLVGPGADADVDMADAEATEGDDTELNKDYDALVKVFETYKEKFEATEWTRDVLAQTY